MFTQLTKIWNDLGLKQRATITISFALVLIGMAVLLAWAGQPDMRLLYSGMNAEDMADMVASLEENGVAYKIGDDGRSLYVPAEAVHKARLNLASKGLPHGGTVGYEIFDRTNFGVSSFAQHTNFIRALQGELARTIAQLEGVRSARVLVVIPENKLLVEDELALPTASVFVDVRSTLNQDNVRAVRHLVANSVEGLDPSRVAVVDQTGRLLSEMDADEDPLNSPDGTLKYRARMESYYTRKVESLLGSVVGLDNVVARVSVDIDLDSETLVRNSFDPESQVVREQNTTENVTVTSETRSAPPVGVNGNEEEAAQVTPSTDNTTREEQTEKNVSYEINETRVEKVVRPGGIRQLSAAVFVALRYDKDASGEAVPKPRTPEELEKFAVMVRQTLGTTKNGRPAEVTVEELPFDAGMEMEEAPMMELPKDPLFWIGQFRYVATLIVALIMFGILLRMLRRQQAQLAGVEILQPEEIESERRAKLQTQLTPEFLNALIVEKPENVSTALKNWVSNNPKHE